MANLEALAKAFTGLGVDEKSLIENLGKSHPEHRTLFRKKTPQLFIEDERSFERWNDHCVRLLKHEFVRFKNALVLWAMHPWERDARLVKEALKKGPQSYGVIVEIACTRSSEELLGARKAYHSLFDQSIEEDVATHIHGSERKLLVALVSAYRYEGPKVKEDAAKSEAKILANAIKNGNKKNPIEDEEVIRILSTRSKAHLKVVYKHYKEVSGNNIHEDLDASDMILKETVECLFTSHAYFSKVLDEAMSSDAHKNTKKGLPRVIVTRADVDLHTQGLTVGRKLISYPVKKDRRLVSCVKTSEAPAIAKTDDSNKQGSLEKNSQRNATFPNGFEALILDVCDETEVAELKLKVGDFEMHLKRNIGVAKAPFTSSTPLSPPPIPTPPMELSAAVSPAPSPSKSSVEKTTPFTNVSFRKSSKLAALEASGASGYVLVASPTVGSFRRNRTVKGKKQPLICKEGDVIKEGQVIGYLDQFGTELPVKSDVAGEVLKLLFNDGDAVGYGDPLVAVLPSFHAIDK